MTRKHIFNRANKEFTRLCGFDLMHGDEYVAGTRDLDSLIAVNHTWLLDHVSDVEGIFMTPELPLPIAAALTSLRSLCDQWAQEPDSNCGDYHTGIAHGQIECANQLGPIMRTLELAASPSPAADEGATEITDSELKAIAIAIEIITTLGTTHKDGQNPERAVSDIAAIIRKRSAVSPKAGREKDHG